MGVLIPPDDFAPTYTSLGFMRFVLLHQLWYFDDFFLINRKKRDFVPSFLFQDLRWKIFNNWSEKRGAGVLPLYFWRHPFLADWPYNFSKGAFRTNLYWFWGGSACGKNAIFWSKLSKKCLKTPSLSWFFFYKFDCGVESFVKLGSL